MVFDVANDPIVNAKENKKKPDCPPSCCISVINSQKAECDASCNSCKCRCTRSKNVNLLPSSHLDNVQDDHLQETSFGQALADYTGIRSLEYGALVDTTRMNLYSIASCGVIEYTAAVSNDYRLTLRNCTKYTRLDCGRNHYNPVRTECVQSNEVSVLHSTLSSDIFSKPTPTSCPFLRATSFQLGLPLTLILLPTLTTGDTLTMNGTTTSMMTTGAGGLT
jgi:hypothetical protein